MSGGRAWRWLVALVILGGLGWQFAVHAPRELPALDAPSPFPLALAFVLGTVSYVAAATAWARLRARGESWVDVGGAWFASLLARYAPGGFWQGGVRAAAHRAGGTPVRESLARYVSEQALACFSAAVLALASHALQPLPMPGLTAALAAIVVAAALVPPLLSRAGTSVAWPRAALGWTLVAHTLMAIGFAAFAASWLPPGAAEPAADARGFLIAGLAGVLAVFVPAGLGIREGVLAWLLAPRIGVAGAVGIAFGARLWLLACEGLAWGAWAVARRRRGSA